MIMNNPNAQVCGKNISMDGLLVANDVKLQWKALFNTTYHCTDDIEVCTRNDPDTNLLEILDWELYRAICAEITDVCYNKYVELTSPKTSLQEERIDLQIDIMLEESD